MMVFGTVGMVVRKPSGCALARRLTKEYTSAYVKDRLCLFENLDNKVQFKQQFGHNNQRVCRDALHAFQVQAATVSSNTFHGRITVTFGGSRQAENEGPSTEHVRRAIL